MWLAKGTVMLVKKFYQVADRCRDAKGGGRLLQWAASIVAIATTIIAMANAGRLQLG
jgi:hypothetical protein